jgi:hypothetical protein
LTDNLLKKKLDKILFSVTNLISPKKDWVRKYGEVFPQTHRKLPSFFPRNTQRIRISAPRAEHEILKFRIIRPIRQYRELSNA